MTDGGDGEYRIGGRLLKNCSLTTLHDERSRLLRSGDPDVANGGLRCSIEAEITLRNRATIESWARNATFRLPGAYRFR